MEAIEGNGGSGEGAVEIALGFRDGAGLCIGTGGGRSGQERLTVSSSCNGDDGPVWWCLGAGSGETGRDEDWFCEKGVRVS